MTPRTALLQSAPGIARVISAAVPIVSLTTLISAEVIAHGGPPSAIVSHQRVGPYSISVWTDADATDDGSAAGEFWIDVEPVDQTTQIPPGTHAIVSVRPLDRSGPTRTARAGPVNGAVSRQFAALVLDHEGRYAVNVSIDGPIGSAEVHAEIDATYDLRPSPLTAAVYVVPFILAGALWIKALLRRFVPPR